MYRYIILYHFIVWYFNTFLQILLQVWPNVNHYARNLLKDSIEPAVAESLANYKMNGFKFERMILGTIVSIIKQYRLRYSSLFFVLLMSLTAFNLRNVPTWQFNLQAPRVGGVKVYDKNLSRDEIIMDIDLL